MLHRVGTWHGADRFADETDSDRAGEAARAVHAAGFIVLALGDAMRSTRIHNTLENRPYTVWEVLFEQDLDPPWEWPG